jgi:hypothetical protein
VDPAQLFSDADRAQLSRHGVELADAVRQLSLLRDPASHDRALDRPARVADGIRRLTPTFTADLLWAAEKARLTGRVSKFVPASGAATRMFQALLEASDGELDDRENEDVARFLGALPRLALRHELARFGISADDPIPSGDRERRELLHRILSASGAGFASRPKGLVPFHDDGERGRTAFEEHLHEALLYAVDARGVARAHFTVPDNSREAFESLLSEIRGPLEAAYGGETVEVTFSSQLRSTDTISVDEAGLPFRDDEGSLLLRPGGHGALLQNLENTRGDVVVIKNIDNVVPSRRVREVVHWNSVLIGHLVTLQESVHVYLREIHEDGSEPHWLEQGLAFAGRQLSVDVPERVRHGDAAAKKVFLVGVLDRPIRVCGMVRNTGEPGGGPFWARRATGRVSLQIVESAEVDLDDPAQAAVWRSSTHFNPVDLVVGLRNWRGRTFSLRDYTDPTAVFRSCKSHGGRRLTALEHPGLWNGAMADWTTVFVEIPASTFAPVKTVFDLLRFEHQ